jgi:hypothetical protein
MATARGNTPQLLSLDGRSLWAVAVSGLLLSLLIIGEAATLLPAVDEPLSTPVLSGPEQEGTDKVAKAIQVVPSVAIPRALKPRGAISGISADASVLLISADPLPYSGQLISARRVGAFAMLSGAGISMRC